MHKFECCRTIAGMLKTRYFDSAATTCMSPEALQTYQEVATTYIGNPSSVHQEGVKAKQFLSQTREQIASLLGIQSSNIIFTSGSSEANALVFNSLIWRMQKQEIIMSNIEHPSVKEYAQLLKHLGWKVVALNAPNGCIDPKDLKNVLNKNTRLVSLMLVNNVTGSIQDIQGMVEIVRAFEEENGGRKIHFHTDATQALGKIDFSLTALGVDSASFSAHKFHGPRGVGFLYNTDPALMSLSRGGMQEGGLRAGTENLAGIGAMYTALEQSLRMREEHHDKVLMLNSLLRNQLSFLPMLSSAEHCSPYILTFAFPKLPSEVFSRMLYDQGFCVSSGSACSSNAKQKGDSTLSAMGFSASLYKSSIRISFSYHTTMDEVEDLIKAITTIYEEHA